MHHNFDTLNAPANEDAVLGRQCRVCLIDRANGLSRGERWQPVTVSTQRIQARIGAGWHKWRIDDPREIEHCDRGDVSLRQAPDREPWRGSNRVEPGKGRPGLCFVVFDPGGVHFLWRMHGLLI